MKDQSNNCESEKIAELEDAGRRKAVKTIVGGVTAIAAYNLLPAKWGTPVIEQVFLPAHAATSGATVHDPCEVEITSGDTASNVQFTIRGYVTPAVSGLPVDIEITATGLSPDAGTSTYPSTMTGLVTNASGAFSLNFLFNPSITRIDAVTTVQGADGSASCGADVPVVIDTIDQERPM